MKYLEYFYTINQEFMEDLRPIRVINDFIGSPALLCTDLGGHISLFSLDYLIETEETKLYTCLAI